MPGLLQWWLKATLNEQTSLPVSLSQLKSNVVSLDCHISQYATICQQLQAEVASLREKLRMYEAGAQAPQQDLPQPPKSGTPQPPQPRTPELHPGSAVLQEESLGTEVQVERVREGNSSDQEQPLEDKDKDLAKEVPIRVSEQSLRRSRLESPGLTLEAKQVVGHLSPQNLERDRYKQ
ncbi:Kinesin-like protein KIF18B [Myotis brandtii]|uniref:Kinesin-like protein KIF18B n=1 Tax=Myotis brandtii TaxID=109478 RepID=S7MPQ0_MYOBR|nr:Kinesin-like protein KIF18B [Myotis brandtii]